MSKEARIEVKDQMGRTIYLSSFPERIISLVPSLTELLFDLGLDEEVVGVTDFCHAPIDKVVHVPKVGGPKEFDFDVICKLQPDLAIGDKEENYQEGILQLQKSVPVWLSDIQTLEDALDMIRGVGELLNRADSAAGLVDEIRDNFETLPDFPLVRTAYLVWNDPLLAAGGESFIDDMLTRCGLENIFRDKPRYPQVSREEIRRAELILLSSDPCDFLQGDIELLERECPDSRILRVDGTMFCWYGSRLRSAPDYFRKLRQRIQ